MLIGQEQVPSYGHEQGAAAYNTAHTSYATTEQYSHQNTAAVGYGYNPPTGAPYNYQDQSGLSATYAHGQAPQRSQFPPYGAR